MRVLSLAFALAFGALVGCFGPGDVYDAAPQAHVLSAPRPATEKPAVCPCGCGQAGCTCVAGECLVADKEKKPRPPRRTHCPCGCSCGAGCACSGAGDCGEPGCTCAAAAQTKKFNAAKARAIRENKPLLIWVAEVCPPCEAKMPGYVHARVKEYFGITEPCVIVGKPDGQGGLDRVVTIPGIPTPEEVAAALNPPPMMAAPPSPPPMMMRPLMMMGGFGGGGC